jgi:hypothetical protein
VKLARLRKPKAKYFLSYVEYRPNINISNIIPTYKYTQNMYPKVRLIGDHRKRKRRKESK